MWIKIAIRNLRKNFRRSFFSVMAIAVGFVAVNIFNGFTTYIFENLQESFIYGIGNGHVTIFHKGYLDNRNLDLTPYLIDKPTLEKTLLVLDGFDEVVVTGEQLFIQGLISNGETSTVFVAQGKNFKAQNEMLKLTKGVVGGVQFTGRPITDEKPSEIAVSQGLAEKLNFHIDDTGIVTAPTIDGYINALDFTVAKIFKGAEELINDKLIYTPISYAQSLYGTDSIERINVLLTPDTDIDDFSYRLNERLSEAGLSLESQTWINLSEYYQRVESMFDIIFGFIFVIVIFIASLSVINTVSITVFERVREIGTIRALGADSAQITALFVMESILLALAGIIVGSLLTVTTWAGIELAEIKWTPPQYTSEIPLEIYLQPSAYGLTVVIFLMLAVLATLPPVWKALKMDIIQALGHI